MASIAAILPSGKEKAAAEILTGSGRTAQKLCNRLKDCGLTSTSKFVKSKERSCLDFLYGPNLR